MTKKLNPASSLLSETNNTNLRTLVEKANYLQTLNKTLLSLLPSPLNQNCRIANIRNDCIILEAASSNWGMLLRYQLPQLLIKLKSIGGLEHLKHIDLYISSHPAPSDKPRYHSSLVVSQHSAEILRQTAKHIYHQPLKETLLRIANKSKLK